MKLHSEKLYHCGDTYFDSLVDDLRSAKKCIYFEAHFFDSRRLGRKITHRLLQALKRDVKVYLIVDGWSPFGCYEKRLFKLLKRHGAHITYFNPIPWKRFSFRHFFKINKRSHKKVYLIDEKIAYLGSFNIDQRQLTPKRGGEGWRDIGLRLQGPIIDDILKGFWEAWAYCKGNDPVHPPCTLQQLALSGVRLNHKNFNRKAYFEDLIGRIYGAKRKIWISNPYFVPDARFCKALAKAALRGVEVKILIPQKSDLKWFPLINSIFYKKLILQKVKIFEYKPSILHAKIFQVDDWTMIGSSNLNTRTQKHDWEIDYSLQQSQSQEEVTQRLVSDFNNSQLVTLQCIIKKFKKVHWTRPLFFAVKYWL